MHSSALALPLRIDESAPRSDVQGRDAAGVKRVLAGEFSLRARPPTASPRLEPARILGLSLAMLLHALAGLQMSLPRPAIEHDPKASVGVGKDVPEQGLQLSFIEASAPLPAAEPLPDPAPAPRSLTRPEPVPPPPAQGRAPEKLPPIEMPEIESAPADAQAVANLPQQPAATAPTQPTAPVATRATPPEADSEARPAPNRAQRSRAKREQQDYVRELMAQLLRHRIYPDAAKKDKTQGTVLVRFSIDRHGRVLSAEIARSSGSAQLDQAALEVLQRASPLPALPASMGRDRLSISLPIEYALITS